MSKFYARFKHTKEEIIVFPTQQERDDWVNFQDKFSKSTNSTAENATFDRIPLTERQANYIIRTLGLTETTTEHLNGSKVMMYTITNSENKEGEKRTMKRNGKITLQPTMGIAERKMIASATEKNAIRIGTKKLAWIPVELMNIPPYQREKQKHVNSIAENWDDDKCDVLTVSYDAENGWFNVMDGQHRAIAAKMRGVEYLVAEIRTGWNRSQESSFYVHQNTSSKKLSHFDVFKANQFISTEDDTVTSILDKRLKAICDEYGIEVRKSEACGVLKSVLHTRKILGNKDKGEACLRFIFEVIQGSQWDKFSNGYCYVVVNALSKVYSEHKDNLEYAKKQLCNYMIKHTYKDLDVLGMSQFANLGRTARWDAVMSQIIA